MMSILSCHYQASILLFVVINIICPTTVMPRTYYGTYKDRMIKRECKKLYCELQEANCEKQTAENTWSCNRINNQLADNGCDKYIQKCPGVCRETSPGPGFQQVQADNCAKTQQCYVMGTTTQSPTGGTGTTPTQPSQTDSTVTGGTEATGGTTSSSATAASSASTGTDATTEATTGTGGTTATGGTEETAASGSTWTGSTAELTTAASVTMDGTETTGTTTAATTTGSLE